MYVYIGTYTGEGRGDGIYVCRFDPESGALTVGDAIPGADNPSFLALDPTNRFVFSANETDPGVVTAFQRDLEGIGGLVELNREESHGAHPCYVATDIPGRYVLVANYGDGAISVFPLGEDGHLQPASDTIVAEGTGHDPARQERPHAHMIAAAPDGRYVLTTDLGLDTLSVFELDTATGHLNPSPSSDGIARTAPGAGPRHFAFSPDGHTVYLINELDNTVNVYGFAEGGLTGRQTIGTLPEGFTGENTTAHIHATPDGRHVYGSNRGHDSIAIFAVGEDGALTSAGHQPTGGGSPRNFTMDPTGAWLIVANQTSDSVFVFRRDPEDGSLSQVGEPVTIPSPVAVLFAGV